MKTVRCFRPGGLFPSISITGSDCGLGCPHCMGRPLKAMTAVECPSALLQVANTLADGGALGFLLSGGCDPRGQLPLNDYLPAIKEIKETTSLKINAHIGFPRKESLHRIANSEIDAFSLSYPISDEIGRRFMKIRNGLKRYSEVAEALNSCGHTIPHMLLGLGGFEAEIEGLRHFAEDPPDAVVFLAFTPLKGTPMSACRPTSDDRIIEVIGVARSMMPNAKIVLGCMRPRGRTSLEVALMRDTLDGIVLPARAALNSLESTLNFENHDGCCALYL